jgi:hypothetical protein
LAGAVPLADMKNRTRPGCTGIGGFMESVLAMMVVICGVVLVTVSLAFVGIDLNRDSGDAALEDGCRSLSSQLSSLGPPFFEGEVLQNTSVPMLNTTLFHAGTGVKGYCMTLQDLTAGSCSIVLLKVGDVSSANQTRSMSFPLLLSMPDRTLHAAKATVIAWR